MDNFLKNLLIFLLAIFGLNIYFIKSCPILLKSRQKDQIKFFDQKLQEKKECFDSFLLSTSYKAEGQKTEYSIKTPYFVELIYY